MENWGLLCGEMVVWGRITNTRDGDWEWLCVQEEGSRRETKLTIGHSRVTIIQC